MIVLNKCLTNNPAGVLVHNKRTFWNDTVCHGQGGMMASHAAYKPPVVIIAMGNCLKGLEVTGTLNNGAKEEIEPTKESLAAARTSSNHPPPKHTLQENITVSENPMDRNIFDYYDKVKHIAQGSTCDVWTIRQKSTGQIYALKIIPKTAASQVFVKELRNEIATIKGIDHPNAVRVYEMFEDHRFIYMVSEYLEGGDLYSRPLPYSEPQAAMVLTRILSAVTYLHKHNVVHRDIKPQNVMYDEKEGEPRLIDFGLSKRNVPGGKSMTFRVGTLIYHEPTSSQRGI